MADKYKNKYRIPSARATWWQYHWAGAYFITICTQNRQHLFGTIKNGIMHLTPLGAIADVLWHEIPRHHTGVELGAFVVMPNHIHGILILDPPAASGLASGNVQTMHASSLPESAASESAASASAAESVSPSEKNEFMASISPKPHSVPAIIRSYKSAVTKHANRLGLENGWQARYYDHIIRNDAAYQRISDYIEQNPQKWESDKFKDSEDDNS